MKEHKANVVPGVIFVVLLLAVLGFIVMRIFGNAVKASPEGLGWIPLLILTFIILLKGVFIVAPNEAKVLTFLGRYTGSVRENGVWFANPFSRKQSISLKVGNFQCPQLKVNDAHGNPIEIAAVIVWRVVDTAQAFFDVENYKAFVNIQCETGLRHLASHFPYEPHQPGEIALRSHLGEVSAKLREEIQGRVAQAGVEIIEAQLSHLAYSPEIAQAMLRRQQASAVLSARQIIVDGAIGMVELALTRLEKDNIVQLDTSARTQLANNLLVTLVSEQHMQPVLSTAVKG